MRATNANLEQRSTNTRTFNGQHVRHLRVAGVQTCVLTEPSHLDGDGRLEDERHARRVTVAKVTSHSLQQPHRRDLVSGQRSRALHRRNRCEKDTTKTTDSTLQRV